MRLKKVLSALLMANLAILSSTHFFTLAANTPREVRIPDGTEIAAVTTETISSKSAQEDDPITFKVDEDVIVDGAVVISKGTLVKGIVTRAKKAGFMGKGGELNIRLETTTAVDGQKIKVRASRGREGENKTGTTIALTVLFGPIGLLKRGKNAEIKEGSKLTVYTDEDKTINVTDL